MARPISQLATEQPRLLAIDRELARLRRERRLFRSLGFAENHLATQIVELELERQKYLPHQPGLGRLKDLLELAGIKPGTAFVRPERKGGDVFSGMAHAFVSFVVQAWTGAVPILELTDVALGPRRRRVDIAARQIVQEVGRFAVVLLDRLSARLISPDLNQEPRQIVAYRRVRVRSRSNVGALAMVELLSESLQKARIRVAGAVAANIVLLFEVMMASGTLIVTMGAPKIAGFGQSAGEDIARLVRGGLGKLGDVPWKGVVRAIREIDTDLEWRV